MSPYCHRRQIQKSERTIERLVADSTLTQAYEWLCKQRAKSSHNNSVWDVRLNWLTLKPILQQQLLTNTYRLMVQYCQRVEIRDGHYYHFNRGILKGCPLSRSVAALYLKPLDDAMRAKGFYQRFMDDWVVMVKTKRQLRKLIKLTHKILACVKLKMHPDKTFFGCIKKGFDFQGIHFGESPSISKTSLENHRLKLAQRYARNESPALIGAISNDGHLGVPVSYVVAMSVVAIK